jgi:chromate transport protein ChrA
VLTSMASLDVAWQRGLFPLSLTWLYLLAALGGAFTGFMLVQRRYLAAGLLGGAVAGLCGVWFSMLVFTHSTYTYKIVMAFTTILGCLPGLLLFAATAVAWLREAGRGLWRDPRPLRVALFAAMAMQLWPLASTNSFAVLPMAGWFFLLLGWALGESRAGR